MPTDAEIEAYGLDQVHACCACLGISDLLRDAIGTRLGVAVDFSVQFLAPLTDAERIDTVENVALVNEANEPRLPTLFEKSQIRSLFRLADIVAARLVRSPVVQQVVGEGAGSVAMSDDGSGAMPSNGEMGAAAGSLMMSDDGSGAMPPDGEMGAAAGSVMMSDDGSET